MCNINIFHEMETPILIRISLCCMAEFGGCFILFNSILIFKQVFFTVIAEIQPADKGKFKEEENIASSKILFVSIHSNTDSLQWACAFSRRIPWRTLNCCGRNAFFSLKLRGTEIDWNVNELVWHLIVRMTGVLVLIMIKQVKQLPLTQMCHYL